MTRPHGVTIAPWDRPRVKLQLESGEVGTHIVRAYGPGQVTVNQEVYRCNLVLTRERVLTNYLPDGFEALQASHFEALMELQPEVVILGTGKRLRFPEAALTRALVQAQIGFEVMDTGAACRTYNILVSEGRRVVAALLID
jgi:uncharacterized protein